MDTHKLKEKLEANSCHIHGDAAYVTVSEDKSLEIETCCLLFRHQILLMAAKYENPVTEATTEV